MAVRPAIRAATQGAIAAAGVIAAGVTEQGNAAHPYMARPVAPNSHKDPFGEILCLWVH